MQRRIVGCRADASMVLAAEPGASVGKVKTTGAVGAIVSPNSEGLRDGLAVATSVG
jgi:hypothetical protein